MSRHWIYKHRCCFVNISINMFIFQVRLFVNSYLGYFNDDRNKILAIKLLLKQTFFIVNMCFCSKHIPPLKYQYKGTILVFKYVWSY